MAEIAANKKPKTGLEKVVNTVSIAAVGSVGIEWGKYLEKQYAAWEAATCLANGLIYEMLVRDMPVWKSKTGTLGKTDEIFGMPAASLAYRITSGTIPTGLEKYASVLPTSVIASMCNNLSANYKKRRRGCLEHFNDRLPLMTFPYHFQVLKSDVKIDVDPQDQDGFVVTFPLLRVAKGVIERVTLRLKKSRNDSYTTGKELTGHPEMPLLEKMRTGLLEYGAVTISHDRRRVSARQAERDSLPVKRDKRGSRYVYEPVIGFSVYFDTDKPVRANQSRFALVHTDAEKFIVVRPWNGRPWNLCQDHKRHAFNVMSPEQMREHIKEHDVLLQRLRQDAKSSDRGSRVRMSDQTGKQHNVLSNFLFNMASLIVGNVKADHGEIRYLHSSDGYMPHFPWYLLENTLKNTALRAGLKFMSIDPFTVGNNGSSKVSENKSTSNTNGQPKTNGHFVLDCEKLMENMKKGESTVRRKRTLKERFEDKSYRAVQHLESAPETLAGKK